MARRGPKGIKRLKEIGQQVVNPLQSPVTTTTPVSAASTRAGRRLTVQQGVGCEDRIVVEDSRALFNGPWAEIEAVAQALEEIATLEGPEVLRIIERVTEERRERFQLWRRPILA